MTVYSRGGIAGFQRHKQLPQTPLLSISPGIGRIAVSTYATGIYNPYAACVMSQTMRT